MLLPAARGFREETPVREIMSSPLLVAGDDSRRVHGGGGRAAVPARPDRGDRLYLDKRLREPDMLDLEVGGLRRKHVRAYWDGCAYVV
jgi:hypothetical protein